MVLLLIENNYEADVANGDEIKLILCFILLYLVNRIKETNVI